MESPAPHPHWQSLGAFHPISASNQEKEGRREEGGGRREKDEKEEKEEKEGRKGATWPHGNLKEGNAGVGGTKGDPNGRGCLLRLLRASHGDLL